MRGYAVRFHVVVSTRPDAEDINNGREEEGMENTAILANPGRRTSNIELPTSNIEVRGTAKTQEHTKNRKFHHGWARINTDKKWNTERGDTNCTNFHEREEFAQAAESFVDTEYAEIEEEKEDEVGRVMRKREMKRMN